MPNRTGVMDGRRDRAAVARSLTRDPGRGPFSGALSFIPPATSRAWTLDAFEVSPEDGEITYAVTVPVWVGR